MSFILRLSDCPVGGQTFHWVWQTVKQPQTMSLPPLCWMFNRAVSLHYYLRVLTLRLFREAVGCLFPKPHTLESDEQHTTGDWPDTL